MLHKNIAETRGFRTLNNQELAAVSGGAIVHSDGSMTLSGGLGSGNNYGGGGLGTGGNGIEGGYGGGYDDGANNFLDPDGGGGDYQDVGLFDSDTDDFDAFIDQQFPDAPEGLILVVGDIGGTKYAAAIGPGGDGYLFVVTDNIFTSDTYNQVGFLEGTRLGSRLNHSQNATAVARATPERKLAASLS